MISAVLANEHMHYWMSSRFRFSFVVKNGGAIGAVTTAITAVPVAVGLCLRGFLR